MLLPRINIFSQWESYALIFFMCGVILRLNGVSRCGSRVESFLLGICLLVLWGYGIIYMKVNGIYYNIVIGSYSCFFLCIASIIIFLKIVSIRIEISNIGKSFIEQCSKNSMGIYFIHLVIGTLFKPIFLTVKYFDSLGVSIIFAIMVWILSLGASIIIGKIPLVRELTKL